MKFPHIFAGSWAKSKVAAGSVLYLAIQVQHPKPRIKDKYFLVTGVDASEVRGFIVNSETPRFVAERDELARCQVTIDMESHPFLDHDSQVACHEIWRLSKSDVVSAIAADGQRFKGLLSKDAATQIVAAAKFATTLSPIDCEEVIARLSSWAGPTS